MNISLKTKSNNIYKNLMSKPNLEKVSKISEELGNIGTKHN